MNSNENIKTGVKPKLIVKNISVKPLPFLSPTNKTITRFDN